MHAFASKLGANIWDLSPISIHARRLIRGTGSAARRGAKAMARRRATGLVRLSVGGFTVWGEARENR